MKKKLITLSLALVILFLALVILTVLPESLQAGRGDPLPAADGNGHWLYDINGNHNGCQSPGSDCTWSS
ncbi:MAG: hypothetical protein NT166_26965 [Candidatus Aminicenantes bacterium]|nr:hypothetical protein [Candidatus Aminicenantes bacterium]